MKTTAQNVGTQPDPNMIYTVGITTQEGISSMSMNISEKYKFPDEATI